MPKKKKKSKITKITKIKSNIKEIKPEKKKQKTEKKQEEKTEEKNQGSEIEEKTQESEEEIKNIGFQNFIQTGSSVSGAGPSLRPISSGAGAVQALRGEPLEMNINTGAESSSRGTDEENQSNLADYAIPESSMEQYREIVREQARMSSEVSPIQTQQVNIEQMGREREAIGSEASMVNPELIGMGSGPRMGAGGILTGVSDEYDVVTPEKTGIDREKDTRPFQEDNLKKTYDERR